MWHMHTHACAKCEYNRIETLNTLIPNSHIVTFVVVYCFLCKSTSYLDLFDCFLASISTCYFVSYWICKFFQYVCSCMFLFHSTENPSCMLRLVRLPILATSPNQLFLYLAWLVVESPARQCCTCLPQRLRPCMLMYDHLCHYECMFIQSALPTVLLVVCILFTHLHTLLHSQPAQTFKLDANFVSGLCGLFSLTASWVESYCLYSAAAAIWRVFFTETNSTMYR